MEPVSVHWRNLAIVALMWATGASVGWFQEGRVRAAAPAGFAKWEARMSLHDAIQQEAIALLALNPTEKGLAFAQATTNVLERRRAKHPSVGDPDAPTTKKGGR